MSSPYLTSSGRRISEFMNKLEFSFCEMWNSLHERASFGILRLSGAPVRLLSLFLLELVLFLLNMTY